MNAPLDRRLNAYRDDLADSRLEGRVEAPRFAEGTLARVVAPVADLRQAPRGDAMTDTQALFGEAVRVFERDGEGWAWVQLEADGYVGYIAAEALGDAGATPTHRVAALRSFRYPAAELKMPPLDALSAGSLVSVADTIENRDTGYAVLADGTAMIARHLRPLGENATDWVEEATAFLNTPYLWAGRSGFGIDCSGLVQLPLMMAGRAVLRDTDMQAETVGNVLTRDWREAALRRGDLVFWKGHVAIMLDGDSALHASGYTMSVTVEPLAEAVERIARRHGQPTLVRRL